MRILFGIMSAVQPAATVASLVDTLGPDHPVMVHHDWSQQPDFHLRRPNLSYVQHPERTGWANWGFSRGILKLVSGAMARVLEDPRFAPLPGRPYRLRTVAVVAARLAPGLIAGMAGALLRPARARARAFRAAAGMARSPSPTTARASDRSV